MNIDIKKESAIYEVIPGKVFEAGERFEHVMALTLDPSSDHKRGMIRCIVSREGDVSKKGFIDRSELFLVETDEKDDFTIGEKAVLKNESEVVSGILEGITKQFGGQWEYLGQEDPDIHIDGKGEVHLYFTMPFLCKEKEKMVINLGHAQGSSIDKLEMTAPVLSSKGSINLNDQNVAKELSVAPENSQGMRHNLIESGDVIDGIYHSTVRVVNAQEYGGTWSRGDVIFHPHKNDVVWAAEHASPGPLFPSSFIDLGEGKSLGIMNGRSATTQADDEKVYGPFTVGLFIYNYEEGKIEWISPENLIEDCDAKSVTFASEFVDGGDGIGTLYAHVDDSFVRGYTVNAESLKALIPEQYKS